MKDKTIIFHWEVRESLAGLDQLRNSRLDIGHVCECWSISRNVSRPTILVLHNNKILANMHNIFATLFLKHYPWHFFLSRYVMLKCRYVHKLPHCELIKRTHTLKNQFIQNVFSSYKILVRARLKVTIFLRATAAKAGRSGHPNFSWWKTRP